MNIEPGQLYIEQLLIGVLSYSIWSFSYLNKE